ncbi:hypothetical protein D9756_009430 [Leucocoprinus leucothites]|uniref:Uncharacterized protein n=1 Tax=Leucocoprinus leucothites TaxID=201217 RepID=A0A8H5FU94_9AGAR|nr:hypothetical protein D9756_009430 [Leucoagaricus leucothites]
MISLQVADCMNVPPALIIHEYFLTFVYEVERFWPKWLQNLFSFGRHSNEPQAERDYGARHDTESEDKNGFTWASLFFFLNRYLTIVSHIPVMLEYFWEAAGNGTREDEYESCISKPDSNDHDRLSCYQLQIYHQCMVLTTQALNACMMIMRVHALYERKTWVVILYLVVCCSVIGVAAWAINASARSTHTYPVVVPVPYGCGLPLGVKECFFWQAGPSIARQFKFYIDIAAAWSGELVFDILVFGMTLYKTLRLPRGGGNGLLSQLMRDGAIYFGAMVMVTVGNILCLLLGGPLSRGSATMITNVISSLAVSRLMLNLRDPTLYLYGYGAGRGYFQETTINGFGFHRAAGDSTWLGARSIVVIGTDEPRPQMGPPNPSQRYVVV